MSTIRATDSSIALINTFFVSPERAEELLQPEVAPHMKRAAEIAGRFDQMLCHVPSSTTARESFARRAG